MSRCAAFACVCIAVVCFGRPVRAQPVSITGAWARATAPFQAQGAVYATLASADGDRLVGLSSPDAAAAMLHRTVRQGDMTGMADMDGLALPPGQTIRLAPRGMHVMLTGLKHPLVAGGHVSLVLIFEHAGRVAADVPVLPIGSAGP